MISNFWKTLQKDSTGPVGEVSLLLEKEVMGICHQLDLCMQSKQQDWEREKQRLDHKIQLSDEKLELEKKALKHRTKEASQLKVEIEGMEKERKEMVEDYERQLASLRNDVATLRKDYEKLHKRYKDKIKQKQSDADSSTEMKNLQDQVQEYQKKSSLLDNARWTLEKKMESVQTENKALNDKNRLLQQQLETLQGQVERGTSTQINMKQRIIELESELARSKETINIQHSQLVNLESLETDLSKEKDRLHSKEREVKHWQEKCDKLQQKAAHMHKNIVEMDDKLQQHTDSSNVELQRKVRQLLSETDALKKSLVKHKGNETKLLKETSDLKQQLDTIRKENLGLAAELEAKVALVKDPECGEVQRLTLEKDPECGEVQRLQHLVSTIKDDWSKEQREHENRVSTLRNQLAELMSQVHEKTASGEDLKDTNTIAKQERPRIYEDTVPATSSQNRKLQSDIKSNKESIRTEKENKKSILKKTEDTITLHYNPLQLDGEMILKDSEEGRCLDIHRVHELQERLRYTVAQYEQRVRSLKDDKLNLEHALHNYKKKLDTVIEFDNGVDDLSIEAVSVNSADEVTAHYLQEVNRRTKDLEQIIILQKNDFERKAEQLFKKYQIYQTTL